MSQEPSTIDTESQSAPPPAPRRWPWRQVLLGVAILACGVAIGAGGATIITKKATRERILQTWRNPRGTQGMMARRIEKELHLSPEQAKQVQDIVSRRMGAVREIMEENRPQVYEQFDLMKEEVAEVLDENQAREWRERFGRLLRGPGPRGRRTRVRDESRTPGPDRRGDADEREPRRDRPPKHR